MNFDRPETTERFSGKMLFPTTLSFAPLHDHKRLPGRFHARLTGADGSDIG